MVNSIKIKLIVMLVIAGAVPMIGAMLLINQRSMDSLISSTQQELIVGAAECEQMLNEHIETFLVDAQFIASLPAVRDFAESSNRGLDIDDQTFEEAGKELAVFQRMHWGRSHHILLTDTSGRVVLNAPGSGWGASGQIKAADMRRSQGPHFGESIGDVEGFTDGLSGPAVTDFFGFVERDHYHQLVLAPVKDLGGETHGVVVIEVAIDYIQDMLESDVAFGKTGRLYLATEYGVRVRHEQHEHWGEPAVIQGVLDAAGAGELVSGWYENEEGREVFGVYLTSMNYPWVLCVEIDRAEIEAPVRAQQQKFVVVSVVSLGAFGCSVLLVTRLFWAPLNRVVSDAERVADGDLWHTIEVTRRDELGNLQGAVEYMRHSMKEQIDHLDAMIAERTAELEYANELLTRDARIDKLTGLANRQAMMRAISDELRRYQKDPSHLIAVLFFDFDRFKIVNDSLGHATGDALLCEIAQRFRAELRDIDLAARFGGDEFVVLLGPIESEERARQAADRLLRIFEEAHVIAGHRIVSTASIGLVIAHDRYQKADEMVRDADAAMYEAKLAGKGQVVVFDEQMFESAKRRLRLEEDLTQAIGKNQLRTAYQPIIGLEDMSLLGFEALIRWEHPELGIVPPDQFIPIAEDTGQIVEIGEWILRDAVSQLRRWDKEFGLDETLSINVNVAKRQLIHPEFIDTVKAVLRENDLEPSRLKIEITESTAIDPRHDMSVTIKQIRDLGVPIAMDDFGTGHSSLSLLHQFDLDVLKIDKSFIQGMEESRELSAVLHAIIALAQNTGMQVVAEGVETHTQIACLISHGCDMVQGYYFSKPVYADEASAFITRPIELKRAA